MKKENELRERTKHPPPQKKRENKRNRQKNENEIKQINRIRTDSEREARRDRDRDRGRERGRGRERRRGGGSLNIPQVTFLRHRPDQRRRKEGPKKTPRNALLDLRSFVARPPASPARGAGSQARRRRWGGLVCLFLLLFVFVFVLLFVFLLF